MNMGPSIDETLNNCNLILCKHISRSVSLGGKFSDPYKQIPYSLIPYFTVFSKLLLFTQLLQLEEWQQFYTEAVVSTQRYFLPLPNWSETLIKLHKQLCLTL